MKRYLTTPTLSWQNKVVSGHQVWVYELKMELAREKAMQPQLDLLGLRGSPLPGAHCLVSSKLLDGSLHNNPNLQSDSPLSNLALLALLNNRYQSVGGWRLGMPRSH